VGARNGGLTNEGSTAERGTGDPGRKSSTSRALAGGPRGDRGGGKRAERGVRGSTGDMVEEAALAFSSCRGGRFR